VFIDEPAAETQDSTESEGSKGDKHFEQNDQKANPITLDTEAIEAEPMEHVLD
jgi:hypothetical protein